MLSYLFGKTASNTDTPTPTPTPSTPTQQPTHPPPPYETVLASCPCKCDPCTCEICECGSEHDTDHIVEDCKVVRGKWMYDGCSSIEEMIQRLREQIEHLKSLQDEGWNVSGIIKDDYAFMHQEITG